jgi:hypothetical protein
MKLERQSWRRMLRDNVPQLGHGRFVRVPSRGAYRPAAGAYVRAMRIIVMNNCGQCYWYACKIGA